MKETFIMKYEQIRLRIRVTIILVLILFLLFLVMIGRGDNMESACLEENQELQFKTIKSEAGVVFEGTDEEAKCGELIELDKAIKEFTEKGYRLGICVRDFESGRCFTYNPDEKMYAASSVKALYVGAIYDIYGDDIPRWVSKLAEPTIVNSANKTYETLCDRVGLEEASEWIGEVAPETGKAMEETMWVDTTAREMAAIWEKIYRTEKNGGESSKEFEDFLSRTIKSPIRAELGEECRVLSKPGWYPKNKCDCASTADAGIVYSEKGPYVIAIISDAPQDFSSLRKVIKEVHLFHERLETK